MIPFGTEARTNMSSYCGTISKEKRANLCNNIKNIYSDPSYVGDLKMHTDVGLAVDAVAASIQQHQECKADIVIIITDFLNDERGSGEHKLSDKTIKRIKDAMESSCTGRYTRFVAVDLNGKGNCLSQLMEDVFNFDGKYLEVVSASQSTKEVEDWFERLRRDIMVTKLRAVIDDANRLSPAKLKVKINIDGKVDARVNWKPSKLYPEIKIDSSYLLGDNFKFINYTKNFTRTTDTLIEVELGKIKNRAMGLHHLKDTLNLGLTLPTEYDAELSRLGVKKPLPNTRSEVSRLIFTFPLSFWFTCTLIILIILYIIGVINAIMRNGKLSFSGKVTFYDDMGNQIDSPVNISRQTSTLVFGAGGSPRLSVDDAVWQFTLTKRNGNPFAVFAKPYFLWERKRGSVASGRAASGKLSPWGSKTVTLACGPTRNERSHSVKIQLLNR